MQPWCNRRSSLAVLDRSVRVLLFRALRGGSRVAAHAVSSSGSPGQGGAQIFSGSYPTLLSGRFADMRCRRRGYYRRRCRRRRRRTAVAETTRARVIAMYRCEWLGLGREGEGLSWRQYKICANRYGK